MTAQLQSNQVAPAAADSAPAQLAGTTVVIVAPWIDIGGADQVVIDTSSALAGACAEVRVVTTQPSPNRWAHRLDSRIAQVWQLPLIATPAMAPDVLVRFVAAQRADVVHLANSRLGYDMLPALTTMRGAPRVVSHLMGEEGKGDGYPRYAATVYGDLIDLFLVVSAELRDTLHGYGISSDRTAVIRPSIDLDHFHPRGLIADHGEALRILLPARLAEEKDPLLALEIVRQAVSAGLDVTLTLTGDGPLFAQVRAAVISMGLTKHVTLTGAVDDIRGQYWSHDLVMLTSTFEATPLAACEAMACGLPVVAPAVGGIPEFVDHEVGALIRERTPAAFIDALVRFGDPNERRRAGAAARARAMELFGSASVRHSLLEAYKRLGREEGPRR